MNDFNYQLKTLKAGLKQEEEILSIISNGHNHAEVKAKVEQLKADFAKMEEWDKKQEVIRASQSLGSVEELRNNFSNGAPSGGA
jgi:translation initiation factor IF-2